MIRLELEIVLTREITTEIEKTFLSRRWPWAYFLNGRNAAARVAFVDTTGLADPGDPWTPGLANPETHGLVDPGTRGPRDPWTPGQVG